MVAIPLDKINYNKVSNYANVLIFKEFYPKTKNVSYYLKSQDLKNTLEFYLSEVEKKITIILSLVIYLPPICSSVS